MREDPTTPINEKEITKEMVMKAMQCETAEDLIAFAKSEGIELTQEEAEAYLAELEDVELDETLLNHVAGGQCYSRKECSYGGTKPLPEYN